MAVITEYRTNILKKLYEDSLEDEENTDVVLVFGRFRTNAPSINVHSLILKSESSVFKNMMTSKVQNRESIKTANGKTLISLPDDQPEAFKSFVKLLYGQNELIKKDQMHKEAIPAFKIAQKYKAVNVVKVCHEYCFPLIIKDFENLNVAEVLELSRKYDVNRISTAVVDHVKGHPSKVFLGIQAKNWANRLGEDMLTQMLSTDSYTLPKYEFDECIPKRCHEVQDWKSANERNLAELANSWLKRMLICKDINTKVGNQPPASKRSRVSVDTEVPLAVRVLQKIRFLQMTQNDLQLCLAELYDFLTPHHIGTILLVCSGVPQDKISDRDGTVGQFIVDTRKRFK